MTNNVMQLDPSDFSKAGDWLTDEAAERFIASKATHVMCKGSLFETIIVHDSYRDRRMVLVGNMVASEVDASPQ